MGAGFPANNRQGVWHDKLGGGFFLENDGRILSVQGPKFASRSSGFDRPSYCNPDSLVSAVAYPENSQPVSGLDLSYAQIHA